MSRPEDHARETLAALNISVDQLVRFVRPLDADETLLLSGSIANGLGNPLSDVDLVLLGRSSPDDAHTPAEAHLQAGPSLLDDREAFALVRPHQDAHRTTSHHADVTEKAKLLPTDFFYLRQHVVHDQRELLRAGRVHVECWLPPALDALGSALSADLAAIAEPTPVAVRSPLSKQQLCVLDRIRSGAVLANPEAAERWRTRLGLDRLVDYLTWYWLDEFFGLRAKMRGAAADDNPVAAQWLLRLTFSALAGALLASVGETNTYPKWRTRLLARHRAAIGDARCARLLSYMFADAISDSGTIEAAADWGGAVAGEIQSSRPAASVSARHGVKVYC